MKKLPSYYWDTSVFLTILQDNSRYGQKPLDAANEILRQTERKEAIIITSDVTTVEVLPLEYDPESIKAYDKFMTIRQWDNMVFRSADHPVCSRAAVLRAKCLNHNPKISLKVADSIHLATALIYGLTEPELVIHCFDGDFETANKALQIPHKICCPEIKTSAQGTLEEEWD
jgi:predicted nucleic acid-binding protein